MKFEQLKYFITLVEEENFLDAADKLYISQSTLSKQIQKLEQELNITLLDRSKRKAKLNKAGNFFYLEAKKIISKYETLLKDLDNYKQNSTLSIGVLPIFNQYNLNNLFNTFKNLYPQVNLIIEEQEEPMLKKGILDKKYDFIIARELFEKNLTNCGTIVTDKIVAIFPDSYHLKNCTSLTLEQLKDEKILTLNNYTTIYKKIISSFVKKKIKPNIIKTGRIENILDYITNSEDGVILLPEQSLKTFSKNNLTILPISPTLKTEILLIKNKGQKYSKNMLLFLNYLEKYPTFSPTKKKR